jgi:hypothetical protein
MTDSPTWLRSTAALMLWLMPGIALRLHAIAAEIETLQRRPRSVLPDEPLEDCLFHGAVDAATRVSDRRVVGGRVG